MEFDEHEIWNRPVTPPTAEPEPAPEATVAPQSGGGRLYASAGAAAHPDAIVALPHHTRSFVSVAELPEPPLPTSEPAAITAEPVVPTPAPVAPIINDPAIADILAPVTPQSTTDDEQPPSFDWAKSIEVQADPLDAFKDWFAEPASDTTAPEVPASTTVAAPVKTGLAAQQLTDAALRARTQLQDLGEVMTSGNFSLRKYSAITIVITTVLGLVDVFLGGTFGMIFGVGLVGSTAFAAFQLDAKDRWAGWVMPAYVAIAAILVAGQFSSGAPGFNPVGQVLLVGTTLISIAPWLAVATAIGAAIPRIRKR